MLQDMIDVRSKSMQTRVLWCTSCVLFVSLFNVAYGESQEKITGLIGRQLELVQPLIIPAELAAKLQGQFKVWHWTPWHRTRTYRNGSVLLEGDCVPANSVDSFPKGWLSDEQLLYGGFIIYLFFGVYAFVLLAVVCNDYFIPCVELICEDLNIPENVAAATFMAVATSCPEFFVNAISTFVSKSDMGIGTIIGSALFNALGVASVGSLAASKPIALESRPVTRDVVIYLLNVGILVAIVWDGLVEWYEATAMAVLYVIYFIFMFNSVRLFNKIGKCFSKSRSNIETNANGKVNDAFDRAPEIQINGIKETDNGVNVESQEQPAKSEKSLFRFPRENSIWGCIWWLYVWPLKLLLTITVPSPKTHRKLYPFAFFMCICWIGGNSYIVSWIMTVIGKTFVIPDSIMGMTFLAFGGCLPEACSIFIMSRKGLGGIGVSNALGANSLAILFALGVPWFIRCMSLLVEGSDSAVTINSAGIEFLIISLFLSVCSLWIILRIASFTLRKTVGFVLLLLYLVFITFAVLVEMGFILGDGKPRC